MNNAQDWNIAIYEALQMFFLAEDFTSVAKCTSLQLKGKNIGDKAEFPIFLEADQPILNHGLGLSINGKASFSEQPDALHFTCHIPVTITKPNWLVNIIHQNHKNELFEIANNQIEGILMVEFSEDDSVYEGTLYNKSREFKLDPRLVLGLRHAAPPANSQLTYLNQWSGFIKKGYETKKNDMDDYLKCHYAAKLLVENATNLGSPKFQKVFMMCLIGHHLDPLERAFPKAFQ